MIQPHQSMKKSVFILGENDDLITHLNQVYEVRIVDWNNVEEVLDLNIPNLLLITEGIEGAAELAEKNLFPVLTVVRNEDDASQISVRLFIVPMSHATPEGIQRYIEHAMLMKPNNLLAGEAFKEIAPGLRHHAINGMIEVNGEAKKLTPHENDLLKVLILHADKVVESTTLYIEVWGPLTPEQLKNLLKKLANALRVHIHRLRVKIESDPNNPQFILTIRGIGYRFSTTPENKGVKKIKARRNKSKK